MDGRRRLSAQTPIGGSNHVTDGNQGNGSANKRIALDQATPEIDAGRRDQPQGLPKGRRTVKTVVVATGGEVVTGTRKCRPCAKNRRKGKGGLL